MCTSWLPSKVHRMAAMCGFCASLLTCVASGADAAKDPLGWGEVRFGMSSEEVVTALRGKSQFRKAPSAPPPFVLDAQGSVNLQAALAASKQILDGKLREGDNDQVADAARRLQKMIKPRQWVLYSQGGPGGGPVDAKGNLLKVPHSRLLGTLESISTPGHAGFDDNGNQVLRSSAVVRPVNKTKQPITWGGMFASWDEASDRYISEVQDAVRVLSDRVSQQRLKAVPREDIESGEIDIAAVTVRGIELQPTVNFDDDKVSEIVLVTRYEGENGELFDEREMHTTLCMALEEKFGPPDARTNSPASAEATWRFPATVITCSRGRTSFPETGFVRKTVLVKYSPVATGNTGVDDNL